MFEIIHQSDNNIQNNLLYNKQIKGLKIPTIVSVVSIVTVIKNPENEPNTYYIQYVHEP